MNKITILSNKQCQIELVDIAIFNKLYKHLSFKQEGIEFNQKFSYGSGWNGITYLLTKGGKFNIGLLETVKKFLKSEYIDFLLEDKRSALIKNNSIDLSSKLEEFKLIPRDYQIEIANLADSNRHGVIRAATASGKSVSIALMIAKLNVPTTIFVIGLDLLGQFHRLLSSLFDEEIGYIGNGVCNIKRINVASIWTVGKALNLKGKVIEDEESEEISPSDLDKLKIQKSLKETKLAILDECHICRCSTITEIHKFMNPDYFFGFSGTPFRGQDDDMAITNILGDQLINISASFLIKKGVLPAPVIKYVTVPSINLNGETYQTVYKNYITENEIRNNLIVKHTKNLIDKNYVSLVLFKQIKHGRILKEKFEEAGIKFDILDGSDSTERRLEVKHKLENKEIDVILASKIFEIGFDCPMISGIVLAGGGKSIVNSLQIIGRSLRPFPGKKMSAIVDFYDQTKYLKKHSKKRVEIYESEPEFKIIKSKEMK